METENNCIRVKENVSKATMLDDTVGERSRG